MLMRLRPFHEREEKHNLLLQEPEKWFGEITDLIKGLIYVIMDEEDSFSALLSTIGMTLRACIVSMVEPLYDHLQNEDKQRQPIYYFVISQAKTKGYCWLSH